ncbi:hypothetical protein POVWA2_059330 [Plasmodium ovale wallikeri]|uniref:Uncharacterized protein n=1 Tax=Plasmodium ovale wallikeri TaxID=864142 RepID=A0A1A9A1H4_PLAOA|nr:hypothetical protein POVWA2_059330 [Plasmodium ovale wallikeri]
MLLSEKILKYHPIHSNILRICPDVGAEYALVNSGTYQFTKIEETRKGEREREREKKKKKEKKKRAGKGINESTEEKSPVLESNEELIGPKGDVTQIKCNEHVHSTLVRKRKVNTKNNKKENI